MADAEKKPDDPAPDGQKTLQAPEGCGFMDMPVLPVQVHLMCTDCEQPMFCVAQVPPLLVTANPRGPVVPDYLHQCAGCDKKVRMKQPFPSIRYAPHPTFSIATPEQKAEMEADQPSLETDSPLTEAPTDSSSEEE